MTPTKTPAEVMQMCRDAADDMDIVKWEQKHGCPGHLSGLRYLATHALAALEQLEGENRQLLEMSCAYCDEKVGPSVSTWDDARKRAVAHFETCPKHPMRKLEVDLREAKSAMRIATKAFISAEAELAALRSPKFPEGLREKLADVIKATAYDHPSARLDSLIREIQPYLSASPAPATMPQEVCAACGKSRGPSSHPYLCLDCYKKQPMPQEAVDLAKIVKSDRDKRPGMDECKCHRCQLADAILSQAQSPGVPATGKGPGTAKPTHRLGVYGVDWVMFACPHGWQIATDTCRFGITDHNNKWDHYKDQCSLTWFRSAAGKKAEWVELPESEALAFLAEHPIPEDKLKLAAVKVETAMPPMVCVQPDAPEVPCYICQTPVKTCERDEAGPSNDYTCPVHTNGWEIENGVWICSEACELARYEDLQNDALNRIAELERQLAGEQTLHKLARMDLLKNSEAWNNEVSSLRKQLETANIAATERNKTCEDLKQQLARLWVMLPCKGGDGVWSSEEVVTAFIKKCTDAEAKLADVKSSFDVVAKVRDDYYAQLIAIRQQLADSQKPVGDAEVEDAYGWLNAVIVDHLVIERVQTLYRAARQRAAAPQFNPSVRGKCPSCGWSSLFLGNNGYVTCSIIGCKNPGAAHELLATIAAEWKRLAVKS